MKDTISHTLGIGALLALIVIAYLLGFHKGQRAGYDRGFDVGYTVGWDYGHGSDWGEYPADQYTIERESNRP